MCLLLFDPDCCLYSSFEASIGTYDSMRDSMVPLVVGYQQELLIRLCSTEIVKSVDQVPEPGAALMSDGSKALVLHL